MNLSAFEAMANSNHRFGAFEEIVKAMFRSGMAISKIAHNPFAAYRSKYKHAQEPEPLTPFQVSVCLSVWLLSLAAVPGCFF